MAQNLELVWFGLALTGIGAGFAFLFWKPAYEEGDEHYAPESTSISVRRYQLIAAGLIVAVLGLSITIWHFVKLILP